MSISTTPASPLSPTTFNIAGILVDVFGLDDLPKPCTSVSCLWLLHGRLKSREVMTSTASSCIRHWNGRPVDVSGSNTRGLLGVSFDQRNHGSREVSAQANQGWKKNDRHAPDMYSIFHGTALDTSILMDHLGSYIFSGSQTPVIDQHLVLGFSLGGHVTWQVIFNEPRVTAGIAVVGCPDYMLLMGDRARNLKREAYIASNGAAFFGSKDFPDSLVSSVLKRDPKGIVFGTDEVNLNPSEGEQALLRDILDAHIKGKRLLVCSGGDDKVVPYRCSEPFLRFLKEANQSWYRDRDFYLEDIVYPGVGHAYSEGMMKDTMRFVNDTLLGRVSDGRRESRI